MLCPFEKKDWSTSIVWYSQTVGVVACADGVSRCWSRKGWAAVAAVEWRMCYCYCCCCC